MRRFSVLSLGLLLALAPAAELLADEVTNQVDAARASYAKGDQLRALVALQGAVGQLSQRLTNQFAKLMPSAPRGWDSGNPEAQSLDGAGGGLGVTQAFSKGDATLNVSLVVDNPTVGASASMIQGASQTARPGWARLKLGADEALLRFDPAARSGEVMIVVGERVLLQVEANEITKDDVLLDMAKSWNTAAVRKFIDGGS
ncbi:hypothetical protein [Telmatospirillum sp.]|uniref:hypothetical protein n=1 Tax=Telmatospirillum sp. TaxID=2079197 RepID=UPI00284B2299|nr:hypothetical protein [Telmatospirillum sp.]MDR3439222.1 hypothetical protein [Telmatospirillum sp.]